MKISHDGYEMNMRTFYKKSELIPYRIKVQARMFSLNII